MDKKEILTAIQEAKKSSKKRKFNQTFDLIMNLKGLDLKNPEHNINAFLKLPFSKGKQNKIGCFVGKELFSRAKDVCDEVIQEKDLAALGKDKKKLKKLYQKIGFFVAQANIMPKIATNVGKVLGPIGKMPNPKAGCVVPPTIPDLKPIIDKLKNTVRLQTKNEPSIKVSVGKQDMNDEEIAENIMAVYNHMLPLLPQEKQNIMNIFVKLTMSKSFLVGKKAEVKEEVPEKVVKKKEKKVEEKPKEKKIKKNGKA